MKTKQSRIFKKPIFMLFYCTAIFLLFSMTSFAKEGDFTITDLSATATISTDSLNVRTGPGKDYDSIGKVTSKDTILITGQASTGWYQIDYNGKEGYISDSYVIISTQESLPESSEYIEGDSQKDPINYTLLIVIIIIIMVIIAIIITTIKPMIGNRSDEDEEDSNEEEYEEEDEVEEEIEISLNHHSSPNPKADAHKSAAIVKEDDYRIYIDPIYFKDDTTTSPLSDDDSQNKPIPESDKELEDALSKLNELQQEIERLKDKRK